MHFSSGSIESKRVTCPTVDNAYIYLPTGPPSSCATAVNMPSSECSTTELRYALMPIFMYYEDEQLIVKPTYVAQAVLKSKTTVSLRQQMRVEKSSCKAFMVSGLFHSI